MNIREMFLSKKRNPPAELYVPLWDGTIYIQKMTLLEAKQLADMDFEKALLKFVVDANGQRVFADCESDLFIDIDPDVLRLITEKFMEVNAMKNIVDEHNEQVATAKKN